MAIEADAKQLTRTDSRAQTKLPPPRLKIKKKQRVKHQRPPTTLKPHKPHPSKRGMAGATFSPYRREVFYKRPIRSAHRDLRQTGVIKKTV